MPLLHIKVLSDMLLDWNMDRKISTIIVDNYWSNNDMIDILLKKLSSSGSLLLNGKIFHMWFAINVLNLIIKEGLDVIGVEIEKIYKSCILVSNTIKSRKVWRCSLTIVSSMQ